jgi:hypothetical protein
VPIALEAMVVTVSVEVVLVVVAVSVTGLGETEQLICVAGDTAQVSVTLPLNALVVGEATVIVEVGVPPGEAVRLVGLAETVKVFVTVSLKAVDVEVK